MIYYYTKQSNPDLDKIHTDVEGSDMTNKDLEWCRWDEKYNRLMIVFIEELSSEDKSKLDLIIENNT